MNQLTNIITPGILLVLTLGFGLWLSLIGKPYNGLLFNIHKLLALGAVVVIAMKFFPAVSYIPPQALFIGLVILAGLGVAALFASGALMSAGKLPYTRMLTTHRIAILITFLDLVVITTLLIH